MPGRVAPARSGLPPRGASERGRSELLCGRDELLLEDGLPLVGRPDEGLPLEERPDVEPPLEGRDDGREPLERGPWGESISFTPFRERLLSISLLQL